MFVSDCICILHGLSDLVKKEFYCRKTKENTTVCLDSKRQKATKKCGYSLSWVPQEKLVRFCLGVRKKKQTQYLWICRFA